MYAQKASKTTKLFMYIKEIIAKNKVSVTKIYSDLSDKHKLVLNTVETSKGERDRGRMQSILA